MAGLGSKRYRLCLGFSDAANKNACACMYLKFELKNAYIASTCMHWIFCKGHAYLSFTGIQMDCGSCILPGRCLGFPGQVWMDIEAFAKGCE